MSWHKPGKARINFKEIKKGFHYFLAPRNLDNLQESEGIRDTNPKGKKKSSALQSLLKQLKLKFPDYGKNWQRE